MNINVTLFGQMITFTLFVWFTMKFVWPMLTSAMDERHAKIADGLAAAEEGKRKLETAGTEVETMLREAREQASQIIDNANKRANQMIEEAKQSAKDEGQRMLGVAQGEIAQAHQLAKDQLREHVATLAIAGAEKLLRRNIDQTANDDLFSELVSEL